MRLSVVTVDVFTDRQFGGNPLAVVVDGGGLSSAQMQSIAAEFNLPETPFVLPPQALAVGDAVAPEIVAQACAIEVADIETRQHQPCIASCGVPLIFAELKE